MLKFIFPLFILLASTNTIGAQKPSASIDALLPSLNYIQQKDTLLYFIKKNSENPPQQIILLKKLQTISIKEKDIDTQLLTIGKLGTAYYYIDDYNKALDFDKQYYEFTLKNKGKKEQAKASINLAISYYQLNNITQSKNYTLKSISLCKELTDTTGQCNAIVHLSSIYSNLNKNDSALFYAKKALALIENTNYNREKGVVYATMSGLFSDIENYHESNKYNILAKTIYIKTNTHNVHIQELEYQIIENFLALGIIDSAQSKLTIFETNPKINGDFKAKTYYLKSKINFLQGEYKKATELLSTLNVDDENLQLKIKILLYQCYLKIKNTKEADIVLTEISKTYANNPNNTLFNYELEEVKGNYLASKNRFADAWMTINKAYQRLFNENKLRSRISYELSVLNEQRENQLKKETLDALKREQDAQIKKKQSYIIAAVIGIILLGIILLIIYRQSRLKQKINKQLEIKNKQIEKQKAHIEEHNKDMTDSITYAKRIQNSILPPNRLFKEYLNEHFVLYMPKDIVSGDFYWIEKQDDIILFAAVDCTGHGVPGALMSVVGFNIINQAVNEKGMLEPAAILSHLDYGVNKMLRQSSEDATVKDSMEIGICALNIKTNVLQFAGAFNPLYLIINGVFTEIKSDKHIIGMNEAGVVDEFTNHTIQLQKGDCIYLFSDGYADQFGGPNGKKFKYNQLKQLLFEHHRKSMAEQKEILQSTIENWMKDVEQIDDILVMGVKI